MGISGVWARIITSAGAVAPVASFFSNALLAVVVLFLLWAVVWIPVGVLVARGFGWPASLGAVICFIGGPLGLIVFLILAVTFRVLGKEPPAGGRGERGSTSEPPTAGDVDEIEDLSL